MAMDALNSLALKNAIRVDSRVEYLMVVPEELVAAFEGAGGFQSRCDSPLPVFQSGCWIASVGNLLTPLSVKPKVNPVSQSRSGTHGYD